MYDDVQIRARIIFKINNHYSEETEFCSEIFIYFVPVLLRVANAVSHIALSISYTCTSQRPAFAIASLVNARITAVSASRRSIRRRGNSGAVSYRYHNRSADTTAPGNIPLFGRGHNSVMAASFERFL